MRVPKQHRRRRGSYAVILAISFPVFLGFAALVVDLTHIWAATNQNQDIADAAAVAAMYTLRRERSRVRAREVAEQTCASNVVVGKSPSCLHVEFGDLESGRFQPGPRNAAVRVVTSRAGTDALGLFFAGIWGQHTADIQSDSVATSRPLELILVLDITISWDPVDFTEARNAAVDMLDTLLATAGPRDRIGLVVFNGPFGWEYTPLTPLEPGLPIDVVRAQWQQLSLASLAGDPARCPWPARCNDHRYTGAQGSDFDHPPGGFYPHMPRNYPDEPATDFYPGVRMADLMFTEGRPSAFRAMVLLTDGRPYQVQSSSTIDRYAAAHQETRWREFKGPIPHNQSDIVADTVYATREMWDTSRVNTWFISFVQDNTSLAPAAQGQGYYLRVADSTQLVRTFRTIAESLPILLAE